MRLVAFPAVDWASVGAAAGTFIYSYQTLIAGLLAIAAALYAGVPVWRQLRDSNLQAMIARRDALDVRLREAVATRARVAKDLETRLFELGRLVSDPIGNPMEIGPHDAFHMQSRIEGVLDWYLSELKGTETAAVEMQKVQLETALSDLGHTLNDVHWIEHNEQHGDDYSIPDSDWAELIERSRNAPLLAAERLSGVWATYRAWQLAIDGWISHLRSTVANLDRRIASFPH